MSITITLIKFPQLFDVENYVEKVENFKIVEMWYNFPQRQDLSTYKTTLDYRQKYTFQHKNF
jgi:hypothetical protein